MSSVRGRPFTVGSHYPANKKTEIYKQESNKWESLQDFPFAKINIEQYGIASTHSNGSTYCFSNLSVIPIYSKVTEIFKIGTSKNHRLY